MTPEPTVSEAPPVPEPEVQEVKKPPKPPINCPHCGWPAEGKLDEEGKMCCWFCKRYPLMRTLVLLPVPVPPPYKLGACCRAGCRGHTCRSDHSYCDLCRQFMISELAR